MMSGVGALFFIGIIFIGIGSIIWIVMQQDD
jgi:hypothetical protein